MRVYQRLTPLTEDEREFASENHWVIDWFFAITRYDRNEFYDVAAVGYLKAVKSWFAREELHEWKFTTIAKQMMLAYIGNELKKRRRRIQTVSLDAYFGESENFTLADTITYDNYQNCYV